MHHLISAGAGVDHVENPLVAVSEIDLGGFESLRAIDLAGYAGKSAEVVDFPGFAGRSGNAEHRQEHQRGNGEGREHPGFGEDRVHICVSWGTFREESDSQQRARILKYAVPGTSPGPRS